MAVLWSLATGLGALSGTYRQLLSARTIVGIGEAGYAPGGSAMMSALYPDRKRSWMMGLWNASIPLGSAIGVAIGGIIATYWGWRHALGIVAIPGFIIAILFFFVKDYKTIGLEKTDTKQDKKAVRRKVRMSVVDMIKEFLAKPSLFFTYFGMAAVVFTTTSLLTWLPTYFHRAQGVLEKDAGVKGGAVMLFAIIGAPLGGYITDRWRKKQINARLLVGSSHVLGIQCIWWKNSVSDTTFYGYFDNGFYSSYCSSYTGCCTPWIEGNLICSGCCNSKPAWSFPGTNCYGCHFG
jgi:MFS family permease